MLVRKGQIDVERSSWCESVKLVRKGQIRTRVGLAQPIPIFSEAYINPAGDLPCAGISTRGQGQGGCCDTGLHPGKP